MNHALDVWMWQLMTLYLPQASGDLIRSQCFRSTTEEVPVVPPIKGDESKLSKKERQARAWAVTFRSFYEAAVKQWDASIAHHSSIHEGIFHLHSMISAEVWKYRSKVPAMSTEEVKKAPHTMVVKSLRNLLTLLAALKRAEVDCFDMITSDMRLGNSQISSISVRAWSVVSERYRNATGHDPIPTRCEVVRKICLNKWVAARCFANRCEPSELVDFWHMPRQLYNELVTPRGAFNSGDFTSSIPPIWIREGMLPRNTRIDVNGHVVYTGPPPTWVPQLSITTLKRLDRENRDFLIEYHRREDTRMAKELRERNEQLRTTTAQPKTEFVNLRDAPTLCRTRESPDSNGDDKGGFDAETLLNYRGFDGDAEAKRGSTLGDRPVPIKGMNIGRFTTLSGRPLRLPGPGYITSDESDSDSDSD